jgi:hypothetical protein
MARKKVKTKNTSTNSANTEDTSVKEWWWRFQPRIADEPLARDGLRKRRNELEAIVEPHLTTRKTEDAVLFQGKRRYVEAKSREPGQENRLVWAAVLALQCLYNLEDAISAGDINAVIQWTYGFTRCDFDAMVIQRCGRDAWGTVALWELDRMMDCARRQKQAEGPKKRRGQNKLQPHDELIKSLHIKYSGEYNHMKLMHTALANEHIVASDDTLRTRLKQLGLYRK